MPGPCKLCGAAYSPLVKTAKGAYTFACPTHTAAVVGQGKKKR